MFCNHCGASNDNDASFCTACGKAIGRPSADVSALATDAQNYPPAGPERAAVTAAVSGSQERVRTLTGNSYCSIHSLAFSPDGRWLISGGGNTLLERITPGKPTKYAPYTTAKLWDVIAARESRAFTGKLPFRCVAFSPDGNCIALGADNEGKPVENAIAIWDLASPNQVRNFIGHEGLVRSLQFSPDGNLLGSTDGRGTVYLWAFNSGQLIRVFKKGGIMAHLGANTLCNNRLLSFSPDGRLVATASRGVDIWDLSTGTLLRTIARRWSSYTSFVSFAPDSRSIVEISGGGSIRIWDVLKGNETRCLVGDPSKKNNIVFVAQDAALDSNASRLAVDTYCSADVPRQKITLWDVANGRILGTLPINDADILALSADGQWLAAPSGRVRSEEEPFVDEIRLWRTSEIK